MRFPDSLDIGFERPSPGSDDMFVSLTVVGDVVPRPREIVPVYSIFRVLLGKDVLDLVGVVLAKWTWLLYTTGVVCVLLHQTLSVSAGKSDGSRIYYGNEGQGTNRWISLKLRRNNDMEVMTLVGHVSGIFSNPACPDFNSVCALG